MKTEVITDEWFIHPINKFSLDVSCYSFDVNSPSIDNFKKQFSKISHAENVLNCANLVLNEKLTFAAAGERLGVSKQRVNFLFSQFKKIAASAILENRMAYMLGDDARAEFNIQMKRNDFYSFNEFLDEHIKSLNGLEILPYQVSFDVAKAILLIMGVDAVTAKCCINARNSNLGFSDFKKLLEKHDRPVSGAQVYLQKWLNDNSEIISTNCDFKINFNCNATDYFKAFQFINFIKSLDI